MSGLGFRELCERLEEKYGPLTEAEKAAADAELARLDAEHARRRATVLRGTNDAE